MSELTRLLLHPQTRLQINGFLEHPHHALLLAGPVGAGKKTVATLICQTVLGQELLNNPYVAQINPSGSTISIDEIRQVSRFLQLTTTGTSDWRRAVIIVDAQRMTAEAQNAFLKALEEPPKDTILILTVTEPSSLLPTIRSRAQLLQVKTVNLDDAEHYFTNKALSKPAIQQAYYISNGNVGLMQQLLRSSGDDSNQTLANIALAKRFLRTDRYERLVLTDEIIAKKIDLDSMLWALKTVSLAGLHQAAASGRPKDVQRWQDIVKAIVKASDEVPARPLPKLLLSDLSLML